MSKSKTSVAEVVGALCDLDPALLVTPPKGKEVGYVPIATRQEWGDSATHPRGH